MARAKKEGQFWALIHYPTQPLSIGDRKNVQFLKGEGRLTASGVPNPLNPRKFTMSRLN